MADEFIFGDRELASAFANAQGWSEVGRAWLKPDGTCVHFIRFSDELSAVKQGERVYVLGKPDAEVTAALKKVHALIATVNVDQTISNLKPTARNFPAPWKVERIPGGFAVKDANGQQLAYVYADKRQIVNTLNEDEARRIASNIAKLPGLLESSKE